LYLYTCPLTEGYVWRHCGLPDL